MKTTSRTILAAAFALLLPACLAFASPAHAQTQPAPPTSASAVYPFRDVPSDHWAYNAVNELHQLGIVVGYPDSSYAETYVPVGSWEYRAVDTLQTAGIYIWLPVGDKMYYTRAEFARSVARLLPVLNARPIGLSPFQKQLQNILKSRPPAMHALGRLIDEFTPELKEMDVDIAGAKAKLDAMERREGKAPAK